MMEVMNMVASILGVHMMAPQCMLMDRANIVTYVVLLFLQMC